MKSRIKNAEVKFFHSGLLCKFASTIPLVCHKHSCLMPALAWTLLTVRIIKGPQTFKTWLAAWVKQGAFLHHAQPQMCQPWQESGVCHAPSTESMAALAATVNQMSNHLVSYKSCDTSPGVVNSSDPCPFASPGK